MIRFIALLLSLSVASARVMVLEWDYSASTNVSGYRVLVGAESRKYTVTNDVGITNRARFDALRTLTAPTNYFTVTAVGICNKPCESAWSGEVIWRKTMPPTNVVLKVPAGKYYVDRALSANAWLNLGVANGPTNVSFPTSDENGFFRWRPYFLSASNPKSGKLAKAPPMFQSKSAATVRNPPVVVNLDPSKR